MSQTPNDPNDPQQPAEGWRQPPQQGWGQSASGNAQNYGQYGPPGNIPGAPYYQPSAPVAKPGSVGLRPLSLGDIFEGTFKSFKYAPLALVIPLLIVNVIMSVAGVRYFFYWMTHNVLPILEGINTADSYTIDSPSDLQQLFPPAFINSFWSLGLVLSLITVVGTFLTVFCYGMVSVSVTRGIAGQKTSFTQAVRLASRKLGGLMGLAGIVSLLYVAVIVVFAATAVAMFNSVLTGSSLLVSMFVPFFFLIPIVAIAGALITVKLFAAPQAAAIESVGPLRALGRSWALTRFNFWRVLGILLLMGIITSIAVSIVSAPFQTFTPMGTADSLGVGEQGTPVDFEQLRQSLMGASWGLGIMSGITSALSAIVMAIVASLLYLDLRFRHEQLHVTIANESASGQQPEIPGSTAQASTMR